MKEKEKKKTERSKGLTISFANIIRTTASTSEFMYYERFQVIKN